MTRSEVILAILARPDEPCMAHRGHRLTQSRDRGRDPEVIKRDLATAYVAWRRQEWTGGDISCVVSVRRQGRLKIARRA